MYLRTNEALVAAASVSGQTVVNGTPGEVLPDSDVVGQSTPDVGQGLRVVARKVRAGRQAAKQAIDTPHIEASPDISIVEATEVDGPAATDQAILTQHAGRLALYEPTLTSADEQGPMVDIRGFEDVFTRFQIPLTNYIYRLVGNREEACDLAQDTFVKAYRKFTEGAKIRADALSSWLYKIANNTATDALRRRRLIKWLPMSIFNEDRGVGAGLSDNSPVDQSRDSRDFSSAAATSSVNANTYSGGRFEDRLADREIVERVLKFLPEKYSVPLLLYEHEGFTVGEVAETMTISPSAVKMRLMRARERFITLYEQEGGEIPGEVFTRRKSGKKSQQSKQSAPALALA